MTIASELLDDCENTPPARVLQLCAKRGHYATPHLNDSLYLHSAGIEDLTALNLHLYYNLKSLHLSGNHIFRIAGLEYLTNLRSLYLQANNIARLENLDMLTELRTLDLSSNRIQTIENVGHLVQLTILNLEHNSIKFLDAAQGLELARLSSLTQLNLARNDLSNIENSPAEYFRTYIPNIKCLYIQGNPAIRQISNLRQSLLDVLPSLTFLDSRPVNRHANVAPPLSPTRAAAISERRQLALARIERERAGRAESVETTEAELEIYVNRLRREYGRDGTGDSTTNDEVSSLPTSEASMDEMD
jgi:dynein assembly factor 1